jgi:hypothetical protein
MYRLIFIILLLLSVLSIGIPFPNPLSDFVFIPLRVLGIDVAMTPMTVDMSMMRDLDNIPMYRKKLGMKLFLEDGKKIVLRPEELDFYHHKMPIILFYEALAKGAYMPEGRAYLCRSFEMIINKKVSSFLLLKDGADEQYLSHEIQRCY